MNVEEVGLFRLESPDKQEPLRCKAEGLCAAEWRPAQRAVLRLMSDRGGVSRLESILGATARRYSIKVLILRGAG